MRELGDCLFPKNITCDICGRETFDGTNLCPSCAKTVTLNDGTTCPICGRKTAVNEVCLECPAHPPAYDRAVSALVYRDGGAGLVMKFKRGGTYLKDYFADLLAPKCRQFAIADGACMGTAFKKDGFFKNHVDVQRVKDFMEIVRDIRAHL